MSAYDRDRRIASSTAEGLLRGGKNTPFEAAVQRAVENGASQQMAYDTTWWTYYKYGKDDLLGENPNNNGVTAAEQRAAHALLRIKKDPNAPSSMPGGRRRTRRRSAKRALIRKTIKKDDTIARIEKSLRRQERLMKLLK